MMIKLPLSKERTKGNENRKKKKEEEKIDSTAAVFYWKHAL